MRKRICLLAALLMLSGCAAPEPPAEFLPESSVPTSSVSSQPAPGMPEASLDIAAPSETEVSSEAEFSAPASSEAASSEVLPPVESEPIPELVCPLAGGQAEVPASSQTQPTVSSEAASSAPPTSSAVSEYIVPEDERPMTDTEVDALIAEAIAYAESKGFYRWDDSMSTDHNGYYNPANSTFGKSKFTESLHYHIDQLYKIAQEDAYWEEGMTISYKIVKGPIEDEPNAWFGYVLY